MLVMCLVVLPYSSLAMRQVSDWLPCVVFLFPSFPLDKIHCSLSCCSVVQDLLDFPQWFLGFFVDLDWILGLDWVVGWFKQIDVEYRVYSHVVW